jgi:hypothetical protein
MSASKEQKEELISEQYYKIGQLIFLHWQESDQPRSEEKRDKATYSYRNQN